MAETAVLCICTCPRDEHRATTRGDRTIYGGCRKHPPHRYTDAAETARVQHVIDGVLLDHSPTTADLVTAARALRARCAQPDTTWDHMPWHELTALVIAVDRYDGRQVHDDGQQILNDVLRRPTIPDDSGPTRPDPAPLRRYRAWRCPTCDWTGQLDDHLDGCGVDLQPVAVLIVTRDLDDTSTGAQP